MNFLRIFVIGVATAGTIWAASATLGKWGIPTVSHPKGVKMRQGSLIGERGAMILPLRAGRRHRGGGMRAGK